MEIEKSREPEPTPSCSEPLHVKRIKQALDLGIFLNQFSADSSDDDDAIVIDDDDSETKDENTGDSSANDSDTQNNIEFYNTSLASQNREWLVKVLEEDVSEPTRNVSSYYKRLLREHRWKKKILSKAQNINHCAYYGAGLLSNFDKYSESKKSITLAKPVLKKKDKIEEDSRINTSVENGIDIQAIEEESNIHPEVIPAIPSVQTSSNSNNVIRRKGKKFKDEESRRKWEDIMTIKRRKVFTNIVKKEIGKQHRAKMNKHKETLIQCKRVALQCQKAARQKALQSARLVKEQPWRMKRLARENIAYWKRSKRFDREIRRKMEKEAEEQRKMDFEIIEAKRQQRKLNFLITQTELYAHFMSRKLGKASAEEQLRILSQLDDEKNPRLSGIDDYDSELMKAKAKKNAQEAFQNERARTRHFDLEAHSQITTDENYKPLDSIDGEHPQPHIFRGSLKGYQLRGMNWLANLYDQGISGILADEMGLGKTVQSIAFLCHIAERYSVWGPFLIISPASTLHNWQQEIAKFVPDFKVVPYWGSPHERKILRQFWDQKDMHTREASFHVVITSYQIVISDIKYFNRIKWQYMILDEAQAIKSTSSMRWKTLLGFSCRNRLLLSGTPIQNSMAELWALLHFIMPTLFDSHEEFNEWFSKDIESHAENKTGINEKHLSRLHMILKPFMLRRIKKDVENELSDKIEVMVYCPLTTRQRLLYMALKQKIRIEDLLHYTVGGGDSHTVDKNFTSNLMNLVMQFRKVCNHPELFERRDAKSPIYIKPCQYNIPHLVYDFNVRLNLYSIVHKYFVFTPEYIAHAVIEDFANTIFNFCTALKLSFREMYSIFNGDILVRWKTYFDAEKDSYKRYRHKYWSGQVRSKPSIKIDYDLKMSNAAIDCSDVLSDLVFTKRSTGHKVIYTHSTHYYHSMPETVEHRNIRCKTLLNPEEHDGVIDVVNDDMKSMNAAAMDIRYKERPSQVFKCERTELPAFLFCAIPKVESTFPQLYCSSRRAAWHLIRHIDDYSWSSLNAYWQKSTETQISQASNQSWYPVPTSAVEVLRPHNGWSHINIPDKESLVTDSGKLSVLDGLLKRLKEEGHRVLIYSQMTKMIDLLEEYMWHRHHKYMRLDGSSKISERRDMVADFQARTDIFVFLLSTRAGGLGINLTAADTVIFYDSDWNPTVDQQAMDRAHRLGQTKQVTVYRLICKGSIEERILQRAREKSEIQKLVISGGNFKPDTLKPKEVVSLLLDDEEIEQKYRQRTEERKNLEDQREAERKRKHSVGFKMVPANQDTKRIKLDVSTDSAIPDEISVAVDSGRSSPRSDLSPDDVNDANYLDIEGDSPITSKYTVYNIYGSTVKPRVAGRGTSKRGRPRGSRRVTTGRIQPTLSSSSGFASGTDDVTPSTSQSSQGTADPSTASPTSGLSPGAPVVRRGPGRPRLKPGGPPHTGSRGTYRPRRPARPLPVPLPSDGASNTNSTSAAVPSYSSYLYDFPEQSDS